MKEIPLTRGLVALVDDDDFERANQFKWTANVHKLAVYAYRMVWPSKKSIGLHRFIINAPDGVLVDHRDHNGLNCQRYNLRLCSPHQNNSNQSIRSNNTSGYKGVSWSKSRCKWVAQIQNGRGVHIGYFDDKIKAAHAYDEKARELFGEFAWLNFP